MSTKQIISVRNEFGKKVELEVVDALKIDNEKYVIVAEKGSDVANAYKQVEHNGEIEYMSIGAGGEFKKVLQVYNERHNN